MDANWQVEYRIDEADVVVFVNDDYAEFARENGAAHLAPPGTLGSNLWALINDLSSIHIYRAILERIRKGLAPVQFHFRCDSPEMRRLLQMRIAGLADRAVAFEVVPVKLQARKRVEILDPGIPRSDAVVMMCAWCKRMPAADGEWAEVEDAVKSLRFFDTAVLPSVSHGMCDKCWQAAVSGIETMQEFVCGELPPDGGIAEEAGVDGDGAE